MEDVEEVGFQVYVCKSQIRENDAADNNPGPPIASFSLQTDVASVLRLSVPNRQGLKSISMDRDACREGHAPCPSFTSSMVQQSKATPFAKANAFQRRFFGALSIIASSEGEVVAIVMS